MTIVAQFSWDDIADVDFGNPARHAWREAVAAIAEKATLPEANGRVDSAVKIVLNGDVELLPDGKAKVASQSNGTAEYFVVNGICECRDFPKAPQGFCKHRIAAGIAKRAAAQVRAQWDAATNGQAGAPSPPTPTQPQGEPVSALPEAPASCNVYVTLAGRKVQVTLRDSDEQRLLARLEALLRRFPAADEAEQETAEGWCGKHGVQMKLRNGEHGAWWSHKTAQGWCKGK